jgi:hypothetical protein
VLSVAADDAPSGAGVYFFLASDTELLYVGKAARLRQRLRQHARVKRDEGAVRLDLLYDRVAAVRWQELPDEAAAAVLEADLIVALRPRFNAAHSLEGRWRYIVADAVAPDTEALRFTLCEGAENRTGRAYGCFPHLGRGVSSPPAIACSDGYTALLRLLWAASTDPAMSVPSRIARSAPDTFTTTVGASLRPSLHSFLSGSSSRLLEGLRAAGEQRARHLQPGLARDHRAAEGFFVHGPQAIRALRLRNREPAGPISRRSIEDLTAAELHDAIGGFARPRPADPADVFLGRRAHPWARADPPELQVQPGASGVSPMT